MRVAAEVAGRQRVLRGATAVLAAPGKIELREVAIHAPEAADVRVRLRGCGVCASNLAPWEGAPWFKYPFPAGDPGHEGWGVVEAVGDEVRDISPGDRVVTIASGTFATHVTVGEAQVVRVPAELGDMPLPGEALGCAMNIFRRSAIEAGQTVAVVGAGFLGLLLVQHAARAGARVIAISRRESSLQAAARMGAAQTIRMDDHWRILEEVKALSGGAMCDRVIEAVGAQWPLDLAGELTGEGARLIIAGYHQDGPRQVNMQLWNWRGFDVINAHERDPKVVRKGITDALIALAHGDLDTEGLYTHVYSLDRLSEALDAARDRPEGFIKAVITIE